MKGRSLHYKNVEVRSLENGKQVIKGNNRTFKDDFAIKKIYEILPFQHEENYQHTKTCYFCLENAICTTFSLFSYIIYHYKLKNKKVTAIFVVKKVANRDQIYIDDKHFFAKLSKLYVNNNVLCYLIIQQGCSFTRFQKIRIKNIE